MLTLLWMTVVGSPNVKSAVAGNDEFAVIVPSLSVGFHVTVAVFVFVPIGFELNVHVYG